MNGPVTIQTQRARDVRRLSRIAARRHGFAFIPWPVGPRAEAADRPGGTVSRCEQRRPVRGVGSDARAWLEVAGHVGQVAARAAGNRIDRTHARGRATGERRQSGLRLVRAHLACHRRLQRQVRTDQNPVWPVARKNTDTPTVSFQHAHRVNRHENSRFSGLIDTPAVSIGPVFGHRMTRLPCSFLYIPTQGVLIRGEKHSLQTRTAPIGGEVQS